MAIDRGLMPIDGEIDDESPLEIEIINPDAVSIETEDGGIIFDFSNQTAAPEEHDANLEVHDANLANLIGDDDLTKIASELVGLYNADKESRSDWEETYVKGLDLLGLKIEDRTTPWAGACGVFHPMLSEAVIRFQAQSIQEIFPASGPVKTNIVGKETKEKVEQSIRVQSYLNYLLTEKMSEYRSETEKMLFSLPLAGSAFRKVYFDQNLGRPCSIFVPAEDFVVSYGATDLNTCERATHVMKKTPNEVRKLQVSGFYSDVDLPPASPFESNIQDKYNKLTGSSGGYDIDDRRTILEMMVDYDLPGFEDKDGIALPYVISIDLSSRTVLSIRRNWYEDDENRERRQHFVHYPYLPGLGFYGFGLVHLVGGLAKSATSILRQLVDAGTLSNLPGGLKTRGLRIKGDNTPIMPGEFRDVDIPSGALRDNITFLPYKEPSGVLYQLLGDIVNEGRRFASQTDVKVADMNNEAPVGTTLALLEQSMKVMSAVQARLHASMRHEFKLISNVIRDFGPGEYPYEIKGKELTSSDFDDRVDIIPVSDPNAGTMAQRIMKYQAALQLAGTNPNMYDMPALHRQMLEVLGIKDADKIVPLKEEMSPRDPVSENMDLITIKPVKAFIYQDHQAHIAAHMAFAEDPKIRGMLEKSGMAQAIMAAFEAHVAEHVAFEYRRQIEEQLGVQLPGQDEPLPEDIELRISRLVAPAAQQLLGKNQAEEQAQQNQQMAQDPVIQMEMQKLQIQQEQVRAKAEAELAKIQSQMEQARMRQKIEEDRIASVENIEKTRIATNAQIEGAKLGVRIAENNAKEGLEKTKISTEAQIAGARLGVDIAKDQMRNA